MFWFAIALLTLAVAVLIVRPLWSTSEGGSTISDEGISIYKRQLAELERDVEAGLVPEGEAGAARNEIQRRLLAADKVVQASKGRASALTAGQRKVLSVAIALVIPIAALMIYMNRGAPGYPDRPYKERCASIDNAAEDAPDLNLMVDCLAVRMEANPQAEGLAMLGRSYMSLGRFVDASRAYADALDVGGPTTESLEGMGIAIIYANQGVVTDMAAESFRQSLLIEPDTPVSKFYLAEFQYQQGNEIEALSAWVDLLEETPPDSPLFEAIDTRIQQGLAMSRGAQTGPTIEDNPQAEMIAGMVDGLAARLEEDPKDLEGWLMLIRSFTVLGETEKAQEATATASLHFITDPAALKQILSLSDELGLNATPGIELPPSD